MGEDAEGALPWRLQGIRKDYDIIVDIKEFKNKVQTYYSGSRWQDLDLVDGVFGGEKAIKAVMLKVSGTTLEKAVFDSVRAAFERGMPVAADKGTFGAQSLKYYLASAIYEYYAADDRRLYYSLIGALLMLNAVGANDAVISEWKQLTRRAWDVLKGIDDGPSNETFPGVYLNGGTLVMLSRAMTNAVLDNMSSYKDDLRVWERLLKRYCPTALK